MNNDPSNPKDEETTDVAQYSASEPTDQPVDPTLADDPEISSEHEPINQPPQPATAPLLLRDPDKMIGGVASGIAKRFNLDVSIVRLLFAIAVFSGFGLLVYLAAWIIIPMADGPLPVTANTQANTRNALAAILIAVGLIIALANLNLASSILLPLGLLGAGIWLLTQSGPQAATTPVSSATIPPTPSVAAPNPVHYPQAKRPGKRRWLVPLVIVALIIPVLFIGALIAGVFVAVANDGNVSFEQSDEGLTVSFDELTTYAPEDLDELPESTFQTMGTVELDLSEVDFDSELGEPTEYTIEVESGLIEVVGVDSDDPVEINASVDDFGDVQLFEENSSGDNLNLALPSSGEPQLVLNLQVGDGSIVVD